MLTVVIGGARSGKSRFAQSLCANSGRVTYLATARAEADDDEMRARIARHRADRPPGWRTVEEPLAIARAAARSAADSDIVLLDCLTLWVSNLCFDRAGESEEALRAAASGEIAGLRAASKQAGIIAVTNEVGCGLVPETAVGRLFRDLQGWVNQDAARAADVVYHVVAGIPIQIKRAGDALAGHKEIL